MSLQSDDLLGRAIGPYTADRLIGHGGFAWVFAGRRAADGTPAAVKVLKPRYAGDPEFERRFRNEATVAAGLSHPNIVRIIDVGQTDQLTYFAMDLYPRSLGTVLQQVPTLTDDELLQIATDVASGLAFAHDQGVVHRDIKPDNILLQDDGTAVIGDFGIARAVSGYVSATGKNMTIGTPHYISPEQAQGRPLDGRSDLYALGVALYKGATGDAPFRSTDWFELARMHVEDQPVAPRSVRSEISPRLERVILKCLAKHPDDRYASARALYDELVQLRSPGRRTSTFGVPPQSASMIRAVRERGAPRKPPKWLVPVVAVLVVLLVAALVVLVGG